MTENLAVMGPSSRDCGGAGDGVRARLGIAREPDIEVRSWRYPARSCWGSLQAQTFYQAMHATPDLGGTVISLYGGRENP